MTDAEMLALEREISAGIAALRSNVRSSGKANSVMPIENLSLSDSANSSVPTSKDGGGNRREIVNLELSAGATNVMGRQLLATNSFKLNAPWGARKASPRPKRNVANFAISHSAHRTRRKSAASTRLPVSLPSFKSGMQAAAAALGAATGAPGANGSGAGGPEYGSTSNTISSIAEEVGDTASAKTGTAARTEGGDRTHSVLSKEETKRE